MKRQTHLLTDGIFDVLVVGGGAFGAAAARDAAMRGLRTALIERADFGSGASAVCFKMIHGGIRYIQHGDVRRLRASPAERSAMLRIAPHLVHPLPIVIPTYGQGRRGKPLLAAGLCVYDLFTTDRNSGIRDPARRISPTRLLGREEVLTQFPGIESHNLTGGAVFEDGQMYNPPRLVLAFVESAVEAGAVAANHVEATEFLRRDGAVRGVVARDCLEGSRFEIQARVVLNAAGPWSDDLLRTAGRISGWRRGHYSRDAYFVVNRAARSRYGLAVQSQSRDRDALLSRSARHLFVVPWRDLTLVGVWHRTFTAPPDEARVDERELETWLAEMRDAYPALSLRRDDISHVNCGLVPFGDGPSTAGDLSFGKESRFIDHRVVHGIRGLVTVIGIRYTTARADASTALDMLLQQLPGGVPERAPTAHRPVAGGDIDDFERFSAEAQHHRPPYVSSATLAALLRNHGCNYGRVLACVRADAADARPIPGCEALLAEVTHAVSQEMAVHLDDIILRRMDIGAGRHPGNAAIEIIAARMQQLLGWSDARRREEAASTRAMLARHWANGVEVAAAAA